jgi:probable HAF family extracellular repeat protein
MNATIGHLFCAAGVLLACAVPCPATPLYHLTPLGYLSGSNFSFATAINASGQVVGYDNSTLDTFPLPFIWSASGGLQAIVTPPLGNPIAGGVPAGINASGEVAGTSYDSHGFVWTSAAGDQNIGTLPGYSAYTPVGGINDSGQVVGSGYASTPTGPRNAFLWTASSGMQNLGTLGGTQSYARAINNAGQVVGDSTTAAGADHAFLWTSGGGMQDLGTLPGETANVAYAINSQGLVVGDATNG